MTGIVVFFLRDSYECDWRRFGAALPAGARPAEITWLEGDAETRALHGFSADSEEGQAIVACRNAACEEVAGMRMVRVPAAVYESRAAALNDGWPDAEHLPGSSGGWTHPNGERQTKPGEWIALDWEDWAQS
jgi:hypothetical protein